MKLSRVPIPGVPQYWPGGTPVLTGGTESWPRGSPVQDVEGVQQFWLRVPQSWLGASLSCGIPWPQLRYSPIWDKGWSTSCWPGLGYPPSGTGTGVLQSGMEAGVPLLARTGVSLGKDRVSETRKELGLGYPIMNRLKILPSPTLDADGKKKIATKICNAFRRVFSVRMHVCVRLSICLSVQVSA